MQRKTPVFSSFRLSLVAALVLGAGMALASGTAQNPEVQARMALMQKMKEATKLFADMAEGKAPFEAAALEAAIEQFRSDADRVEVLFKPRADDPASEALPDIWNAPGEFRQKVSRMVKAANGLEAGSPAALGESLAPVMAACKDCHGRFKM